MLTLLITAQPMQEFGFGLTGLIFGFNPN